MTRKVRTVYCRAYLKIRLYKVYGITPYHLTLTVWSCVWLFKSCRHGQTGIKDESLSGRFQSFFRGGPTLTTFLVVDEGREAPKTTISGPPSARQRNGVSLAG